MEKTIDRQRILLRHLNPAAAASPAPPAISVRIPPPFSLCLVRSDQFGGCAGPIDRCNPAPDLLLNDEAGVWVRRRQARARRGTAPRTTGGRPSPTTSSSSRK